MYRYTKRGFLETPRTRNAETCTVDDPSAQAERRDEENEQTTQEPKRFKQSSITGSLHVRMMVTLLGSTLIE